MRDYSAAARTARLALSFVLGLLSLLFQQRSALCHVRFHVSFSPPLFAGSFAGHFKNTMVPYWRPPKLHFENTMVPCQLPHRFTLRTWLWDYREIQVHFKFFTTRLSLFNKYECIYGTTYEHTYIQTPLAFNTLMWGSLRLAPIMSERVQSLKLASVT